MSDHELYALGDLPLQNGGTLQDARLAYKTYGALNAARTNAIVVPSAYGGTHADNEWLIGDGKALDTSRYFVVATNMFGNGLHLAELSSAARRVSKCHRIRQRCRAASPDDRKVRREEDCAGDRVFDGRAAIVSLGVRVPGSRRAHCVRLRIGANVGS